ncbi:MAG TPA: Dyp-type peroxidase [Acidimicrobiales bacterium]
MAPTPIPQPGIFAQGTRSHYHLELSVRSDATDAAVLDGLRQLREPQVTAGGVNLVLGLGPELWSRLSPGQAPAELRAFSPIDGLDGTSAPATQHDIWLWVHGTGEDVAFDTARAAAVALAEVATVELEQPAFVYKDSRDLTGFIDGSANPPSEEAAEVALVPSGSAGAGGAFVLAQRWIHDLGAFHALSVREQERVFGRTKSDSIEMDDDTKPANAHIARVEVDIDGEEAEIYRRSTPFGTLAEHGLYFLAFSAELRRFEVMLHNMFGLGDGPRDRLTDFSRPVSGSFFFAPSVDALNDLLS